MAKKTKTRAQCPLCGQTAELQRSHVIPEFAYRPLYDVKGRAIAFDPRNPRSHHKIQQGIREQLLCWDCEQFLSKNYELPFKQYWFDAKPLNELKYKKHAIIHIPDPRTFKLFHLSVLLRADLAAGAQWRFVRLGSRHRERLRSMVMNKDAGADHDYPISCVALEIPEQHGVWWDLVGHPTNGKLDGMRFYEIAFGGCSWHYFVASHCLPVVAKCSLRDDGTLPVIKKPWGVASIYAPDSDFRSVQLRP